LLVAEPLLAPAVFLTEEMRGLLGQVGFARGEPLGLEVELTLALRNPQRKLLLAVAQPAVLDG